MRKLLPRVHTFAPSVSDEVLDAHLRLTLSPSYAAVAPSIFGTDQKLTAKEPFLSLLYHFSFEIKRSDLVIAIGYSFADNHLNDILLQRMRENLRLKVLVVHPSPENILISVPDLVSNPRVFHLRKRAKEALNDGLVLEQAKRLIMAIADEKPF